MGATIRSEKLRAFWPILGTSLLLACADDGGTIEYKSGDYQFYTLAADDGCLDGALEALFMPEGPDSEHAFEYAIYVAGREELPATYDVDLREPFMGMTVTLTAAEDGTVRLRGSVMDEISLGAAYGDCVTTMTVDADFTPVTTSQLEGRARIDMSDARGDDGLCPVFDANPCEVTLTLVGDRE
jgi:hypothetical protein